MRRLISIRGDSAAIALRGLVPDKISGRALEAHSIVLRAGQEIFRNGIVGRRMSFGHSNVAIERRPSPAGYVWIAQFENTAVAGVKDVAVGVKSHRA